MQINDWTVAKVEEQLELTHRGTTEHQLQPFINLRYFLTNEVSNQLEFNEVFGKVLACFIDRSADGYSYSGTYEGAISRHCISALGEFALLSKRFNIRNQQHLEALRNITPGQLVYTFNDKLSPIVHGKSKDPQADLHLRKACIKALGLKVKHARSFKDLGQVGDLAAGNVHMELEKVVKHDVSERAKEIVFAYLNAVATNNSTAGRLDGTAAQKIAEQVTKVKPDKRKTPAYHTKVMHALVFCSTAYHVPT